MNERQPTTPVDEIVTADLFKREVRRWAERIGVDIKEIHLRPMSRKWASASSAGRLTFDVDLLQEAPERRAEVIVHELVHLRVGNHGPLFRSLLRSHLSEWKSTDDDRCRGG
ncbi:MAG: M48 family metallopeptidase [Actinomycetota bacterium]|nr:M48 family metallopeptidase [Actinomycetota bacterium]